jgi:hypothetical protein
VDYGAATVEFEQFGVQGLVATNGLTASENQELFGMGSVDAALYLTMKGLAAVWH